MPRAPALSRSFSAPPCVFCSHALEASAQPGVAHVWSIVVVLNRLLHRGSVAVGLRLRALPGEGSGSGVDERLVSVLGGADASSETRGTQLLISASRAFFLQAMYACEHARLHA